MLHMEAALEAVPECTICTHRLPVVASEPDPFPGCPGQTITLPTTARGMHQGLKYGAEISKGHKSVRYLPPKQQITEHLPICSLLGHIISII
jgi:hypothetical protein